jgi:endonuclease YncB( thermonuclease family)
VSSGKEIKVEIKKWDKYGGRVLGDLIIDGKRLSAQLIDAGLAIEYNGEKKTKDWCQ